jgi:hypothetical protein
VNAELQDTPAEQGSTAKLTVGRVGNKTEPTEEEKKNPDLVIERWPDGTINKLNKSSPVGEMSPLAKPLYYDSQMPT